ncbi:MAG TPA: DNA oxidative demethylase AlkB [Gammaproteobacteria bacterium]|nr:DNA oxidative demethylase AlkB [Gammaproteobacteria bacterium]
MEPLRLFDDTQRGAADHQALGSGAAVLRGFAMPRSAELAAALREVERQAPFRHMVTPGGFRMSAAMTNCGPLGWTSDSSGYRYTARDPESGEPWPPLPSTILALAKEAAARAGFEGFEPDACLVNRYEPGARLSLHQDKDESDFGAPIVSVSLGLPATFLFGGLRRNDEKQKVPLFHGDVVVWGGPARLRYHGVLAIKEGHHPFAGARRINLTLRKAGPLKPLADAGSQ